MDMHSLLVEKEGGLLPFVYTPLSEPSNIRLFCLEPGKEDEVITLSLFESRMSSKYLKDQRYYKSYHTFQDPALKRAPKHSEYMAVSYVWGDESERMTIGINNASVKVTHNLYQFLKQMRSQKYWRGPYWVDAICINQSDDEEKSNQVSMMSRIFSETWLGIVWLGPQSDDSHMAFDLFEGFEAKIQEVHNRRTFPNARALKDVWFGDYLASSSPRAWQAAFKLWSRPWFHRIWTVQEFVLPYDLDILCGPRRLSWRTLLTFNNALQSLDAQNRRKIGIGSGDGNIIRGFETACWHRSHWYRPEWCRRGPYIEWRIFPEHHNVERVSDLTDLLNSVRMQRHRETTDDRDKIYGLLGLNPDETFPVDYTMSVASVYHRFALHYLCKADPWRILFNAGYPKATTQLPTWVPDWSARRQPSNHNFRPELYNGAGGVLFCPGTFRLSHDRMALIGRGLIIGPVMYCQSATPTDFHDLSGYSRRSWVEANESLADHILAYENLQTSSKDLDDLVLEKLLKIISFGLEYDDEGNGKRMLHPPSPKHMLSAPDYTQGRAFFVAEGGFAGLGPRDSEPCDVAVIFIGLPFPFIVRPKDKHVEIVGPCYSECSEISLPARSDTYHSRRSYGWRDEDRPAEKKNPRLRDQIESGSMPYLRRSILRHGKLSIRQHKFSAVCWQKPLHDFAA